MGFPICVGMVVGQLVLHGVDGVKGGGCVPGLVAVKFRCVEFPLWWKGWLVAAGSGVCYVCVLFLFPYVWPWLWAMSFVIFMIHCVYPFFDMYVCNWFGSGSG